MSRQDGEKRPAVALKSDSDVKALPECGHPTPAGPCRSTILTVATGRTKCWMHSVPRDEVLAATMKGADASARVTRNPMASDPHLLTRRAIQNHISRSAGRLERGEISERRHLADLRTAEMALRAYSYDLTEKLAEVESLVEQARRSGRLHAVRPLQIGAP